MRIVEAADCVTRRRNEPNRTHSQAIAKPHFSLKNAETAIYSTRAADETNPMPASVATAPSRFPLEFDPEFGISFPFADPSGRCVLGW
jgi:hypothetical protein